MKIVRDEPGRVLHLSEAGLGLIAGQGCILLFLVPFWVVPAFIVLTAFMASHSGEAVPVIGFMGIFFLFWYLIVGAITYVVLRSTRGLSTFLLDGGAGAWFVEERGLAGLFARRMEVPLPAIQKLTLSTLRLRPASFGTGLPLHARLKINDGRGERKESFNLRVEYLDKREEVMDFAFRMASVIGLSSYRVDRNDPLDFQITLFRGAKEATEAVPAVDRPADYMRDRIGAGVELPPEVVAPFEPDRFRSPFQVQVWTPGKEVRLFKPLQKAQLGCGLPFIGVFIVVGVVVLASGIARSSPEIGLIIFGAIWTGFSILGAVGLVYASLPQLSLVDWGARTILIQRTRKTLDFPFAGLREIEVRGVRTYHSGGKNRSSYNSYRCQIVVHGEERTERGMRAEMLAETEDLREDPATPYRGALPLGVELARALGVPYRWTDYR